MPEPTPELLVYLFPQTFSVPVIEDLDISFDLDPEDAEELEDYLPDLDGPEEAHAEGPLPRSRYRPLAVTILAVAFHSLHRSGNVQLEVSKTRRWLLPVTHVALRWNPENGLPDGLAGDLYRGAAGSPTATAAVSAWLERDRPNPFNDVVEGVAAEGVRRGFLRTDGSVVESAVRPLEDLAEDTANEFRRLSVGYAELFRQLWSDIRKALQERTEEVPGV